MLAQQVHSLANRITYFASCIAKYSGGLHLLRHEVLQLSYHSIDGHPVKLLVRDRKKQLTPSPREVFESGISLSFKNLDDILLEELVVLGSWAQEV